MTNKQVDHLVAVAREVLREADQIGGRTRTVSRCEIDRLRAALPDADETTRQYATPNEISRARDLHQTDEVEIDDDAKASRAADGSGVWVAAWVWLPTDCE